MTDNLFEGNETRPLNGLRKRTTYDAEMVVHEVSEENLDRMIKMNRNTDWDIFLTCVGIAIGFLQNALMLLESISEGRVVTFWDASSSAIFVAAVAVGLRSFFSWRSGKNDLANALDALRERPQKEEDYHAQLEGSPERKD